MSYRKLFEGLDIKVPLNDGTMSRYINLDNGATTPPLKAINDQLYEWVKYYGPIGRGTGQKGDWSSNAFEESKSNLLRFFNANTNPNYQVVYTKSATEAMNVLARILIKEQTDEVLLTRMEHHANDLPWRYYGTPIYAEVDAKGRVTKQEIERHLKEHKGRIKYLSITGASNVTGYMPPVHELAKLCHSYHAKIIVDAAQLVAHRQIDILGQRPDEAIDFLVFSGHKMYAPFGAGAIVGNFENVHVDVPLIWGGGMVEEVTDTHCIVERVPSVLEGGTQNLLGVKAIETACSILNTVGFKAIEAHEHELKKVLFSELKQLDKVILYGDTEQVDDRLGVITFNVKGKTYIEVANLLADQFGIATRCGKFCAHPYVERLLNLNPYDAKDVPSYYGEYGMIRISLGLYNTLKEVETFVEALNYICR